MSQQIHILGKIEAYSIRFAFDRSGKAIITCNVLLPVKRASAPSTQLSISAS